jgi:hypothetical protein
MKKMLFAPVVCAMAALTFASCASGPSRTVTRVSADTQIDLSGRWNDSDAQMVANAMISDVLARPWLGDFTGENKRKPVVIVGDVKNHSCLDFALEAVGHGVGAAGRDEAAPALIQSSGFSH